MARNATIQDAVKLARKRFEDSYLVEMDHQDGRRRYTVPSESIETDEFEAFDGKTVAFVSKFGEVERL